MDNANITNAVNFEGFAKKYSEALYNYLKKLTGISEDAEDILQEVLIRIAEHLPDLREPDRIKTWAFRIATNAAVDYFRKRSRNVLVLDESIINETGSGDDIEDQAVVEEMNECIRIEMGRIAPLYHTVLVLHYFEGMNIQEIAGICDISEATAKIRLHRGRNLLHRILNEGCDFYYDTRNNIRCSRKQLKPTNAVSSCMIGGKKISPGSGRIIA